MRADGRNPKQMRPIEIKAEVARYDEGSVEISFGHTRIYCTATVEPTATKWLQGTGQV